MKNFIKNTVMIGAGNTIIYIKGILLFIVITKLLGVAEFGIWSQLLVTLKLITPLTFLGLMAALIKFLSGQNDKETAQEIFYSIAVTVFISSIMAAVLLFVLSQSIAVSLMKDINAVNPLRVIAVLFPVYIFSELLSAYFQAVLKIKEYTLLFIGFSFFELFFAILVLYLGWKILGLVLAIMCARLIMVLLMYPLLVRAMSFKWPKFSLLASFLLFGLPLLPVSFSSWVLDSSDRYLIGYFLTPKDIGIYSASYMLGSFVLFFITPVGTVLYPTISGLWNNNKVEELKAYISHVIKYSLMCIIPLATILIVLSKPLIILFSTKEFYSGNLIIAVIILAMTFYAIALLSEKILTVFKKTKFILLSYCIAAFSNFIFNIILIPIFGILGAAIATSVGYFILLFLILAKTLKIIRFKFEFSVLFKSIAAGAVMAVLLFITKPDNFTGVFLAVLAGLLSYVALLILTGAVNRREAIFLKQFLRLRRSA